MSRLTVAARAAAPALIAVAAVVTAGCSATPAATPTASAPSSATVGQDASTWAPTEITADMLGGKVDLVVGQRAVFTGLPEATGYETYSDSNAVAVAIPQDPPSQVTGFTAVEPGTATVTLLVVTEEINDRVGTTATEPVGTITVNVTANPNG